MVKKHIVSPAATLHLSSSSSDQAAARHRYLRFTGEHLQQHGYPLAAAAARKRATQAIKWSADDSDPVARPQGLIELNVAVVACQILQSLYKSAWHPGWLHSKTYKTKHTDSAIHRTPGLALAIKRYKDIAGEQRLGGTCRLLTQTPGPFDNGAIAHETLSRQMRER